MFDLFTIALLQLATFFGVPAGQPTPNQAPPQPTEVGSGGWGHDIIDEPAPTPQGNEVGSGGWGHD